jgi:hypothetical protein
MRLHGWEETAQKLSGLAARGAWIEMPALITDDMLAEFAIIAAPDNIPAALRARYQGLVDRIGLYIPFKPGERDEFWKKLLHSV